MINTLEIDSLSVQYKNTVILNGVYLKLEVGKITGLFGRNGSGKSSLMQFIFGNLKTPQGQLRFNNRLLSKNKIYDIISYLPQSNFIPNHYSIQTVLKDYKVNPSTFCKSFPIFNNQLKRKVKNLSGGEKRLLEFYIVLNSKSKFCILDEPFASIMPKNINKMIELIQVKSKEKGILICDHQNEYIKQCLHDSLFIENKQIIQKPY